MLYRLGSCLSEKKGKGKKKERQTGLQSPELLMLSWMSWVLKFPAASLLDGGGKKASLLLLAYKIFPAPSESDVWAALDVQSVQIQVALGIGYFQAGICRSKSEAWEALYSWLKTTMRLMGKLPVMLLCMQGICSLYLQPTATSEHDCWISDEGDIVMGPKLALIIYIACN